MATCVLREVPLIHSATSPAVLARRFLTGGCLNSVAAAGGGVSAEEGPVGATGTQEDVRCGVPRGGSLLLLVVMLVVLLVVMLVVLLVVLLVVMLVVLLVVMW